MGRCLKTYENENESERDRVYTVERRRKDLFLWGMDIRTWYRCRRAANGKIDKYVVVLLLARMAMTSFFISFRVLLHDSYMTPRVEEY